MSPPLLALPFLLLASAGTFAQQAPLGRLFFTPEQRAQMDRQRLRSGLIGSQENSDAPLTFNGQVTRSSGGRTLWLNGVPVDAASTPAPTGTLRPGETALGAGVKADLLNGGTIVVTPRRGTP